MMVEGAGVLKLRIAHLREELHQPQAQVLMLRIVEFVGNSS
jgi:hypothetical protein